MARGYVLLTVATSAVQDVIAQIREGDEVKQAEALVGAFDVIAEIEATLGDTLLVLGTDHIRSLAGVGRVHTCLIRE